MRTRICKKCNRLFNIENGSTAYLCPECSKQAKRESVLQERTCKICGTLFVGYPKSIFCLECRDKRRKENERKYRQHGSARKLGSIDCCIACGKEYIVKSGLQKYCPECAKMQVSKNIREHKAKYMQDNRDKANQLKQETLGKRYVCKVCGKEFEKHTARVTCSDECAKELKRIRQAEIDIKRGKRKLPADQKYDSGLPKSGIPGIAWKRENKKWQLTYKGKYVGIYKTIEEAKLAKENYIQNLKNN